MRMRPLFAVFGLGLLLFGASCTPMPTVALQATPADLRASDGSIAGMLDRYWDPDRNCFADTTFTGSVALGVVEGTFKTRFDCGTGEATGTWSVNKKAARRTEVWR